MESGAREAFKAFYDSEDMMDSCRYGCLIQYVVSIPVDGFREELEIIGFGFSDGEMERVLISIERDDRVLVGKVYIFDTVMGMELFLDELPKDRRELIIDYDKKTEKRRLL